MIIYLRGAAGPERTSEEKTYLVNINFKKKCRNKHFQNFLGSFLTDELIHLHINLAINQHKHRLGVIN